jgi:hypothetical protein
VVLADELAERRRAHARREGQVARRDTGPAAGRVLYVEEPLHGRILPMTHAVVLITATFSIGA